MTPSEKRRLGRVDLEVTAMGFGGVQIGNLFHAVTDGEVEAMIKAAWDAGIRLYDAAPLYGHGLAELRFGHSLRLENRDDFVLASKVGRVLKPRRRAEVSFGPWADVPSFEMIFDYSYDGTMRAFEDSLQRLALERMDICFIHDIDRTTRGDDQPEVFRQAMNGSWKALEKLRSEGLVKAIGVGVNEWQVCQEALKQRDFDCFLLAGRYTLLEQEALEEFLPLCEKRGVSIVVGGGFNSGILASGSVAGARYNYGPAPPEIIERVRKIESVCLDHRVPMPAAALQFVVAHPAVASFITGTRTVAQLEQNLKWFNSPIPTAFWSDLKAKGLLRDDAPVPATSRM
jgi:D-threo-aldose 1-dehydrogenase